MNWDPSAYPIETLRFCFGDRRRPGDTELLERLVSTLNDRQWVVGRARSIAAGTKVAFPTCTIRASRRHVSRTRPARTEPSTLLPFAGTGSGDHFCIGIGPPYRDQHDHPRADASHNAEDAGPWLECLCLVAPTFDAFLDGIVFEVGDRDDECSRIDGVDHEAARERSRAVAQSVKGTSITTRRC